MAKRVENGSTENGERRTLNGERSALKLEAQSFESKRKFSKPNDVNIVRTASKVWSQKFAGRSGKNRTSFRLELRCFLCAGSSVQPHSKTGSNPLTVKLTFWIIDDVNMLKMCIIREFRLKLEQKFRREHSEWFKEFVFGNSNLWILSLNDHAGRSWRSPYAFAGRGHNLNGLVHAL